MLLVSSGIRVHPIGLAGYGGMCDGWLFVVKDIVRENIGNLCKGDCSQASRYTASGKYGLVYLAPCTRSSMINSFVLYNTVISWLYQCYDSSTRSLSLFWSIQTSSTITEASTLGEGVATLLLAADWVSRGGTRNTLMTAYPFSRRQF